MKLTKRTNQEELSNYQRSLIGGLGWVIIRFGLWLLSGLWSDSSSNLLALARVFLLTLANALLLITIISLLIAVFRSLLSTFNDRVN